MKLCKYSDLAICLLVFFTAGSSSFAQNHPDSDFKTIKNTNGPTLGFSPSSGIRILTIDGLHFKDLNKNGRLDAYEDWRLPVDTRSKDLAGKMTVELML